jgi:hypothetical protein
MSLSGLEQDSENAFLNRCSYDETCSSIICFVSMPELTINLLI